MSVVIGIDVGGSTTKIVAFRQDEGGYSLIAPLYVKAADPVTSIYGAFGKFTDKNGLSLSRIDKVMMTGVGSSHIHDRIYNLPCINVPEFRSIGRGGLYLSDAEEAIVVSMGTGTAMVHAKKNLEPDYLGGTGVGGGTLLGLSKKMLGIESIEHLVALSEEGDLSRVDLRIADITQKAILPERMTAANFGKVSDLATPADLALGIINMVFETVGMMALFAARSRHVDNIILTGNLTRVSYARPFFTEFSAMFHKNFRIPANAEFATVIGAALCG